jgi:ketosteroid isomerase-like protein
LSALIWSTGSAEGRVIATDGPYRVRYVWVYTEADRKIVNQADYWRPTAVVEALVGHATMRETFNITS